MNNILSPVKCLPGVVQTLRKGNEGHFCVHPDGSSVFIFDKQKNSFEIVDLETSKRTNIKLETPDGINPERLWRGFFLVKRAARHFLLAITYYPKSRQTFFVSLLYNGSRISYFNMLKLHNIGSFASEDKILKFAEDLEGHLYCVSYYFQDGLTTFDTLNVVLDDNGTITTTHLAQLVSFPGNFHLPFICSGSIFWLLKENEQILFKKLFQCSLESREYTAVVELTRDSDYINTEQGITIFEWNQPIVIGNNIFFYAFDCKKKTGFLFVLIWNEKRWRKIALSDFSHAIIPVGCIGMSTNSGNSFLILHGKCSTKYCTDMAHIYIIDVSEYDGKKADDHRPLAETLEHTEQISSSNHHTADSLTEQIQRALHAVENQWEANEATADRLRNERETNDACRRQEEKEKRHAKWEAMMQVLNEAEHVRCANENDLHQACGEIQRLEKVISEGEAHRDSQRNLFQTELEDQRNVLDDTKRKLKEKYRKTAEKRTESLMKECAAKDETILQLQHAVREAKSNLQAAEEEIGQLRKERDEAEHLRHALREAESDLQVAKEETEQLRKERNFKDHLRRNEHEWTPKNYVKKEELGKGAFGTVYKCFDTDEYKFFVGKETFSQRKEVLDAAKNEIDRLKDMSHIRIINYYGFKDEGEKIIIFMEYMAAGSLKQLIDIYGPIKEPVTLIYIQQILDALSYIHNIGIVHCDLKCDNLLHDGQGNVKLGDFGIAVQKILNSIGHSYFTENVKGGGTCHWMAPEIQNDEGCSRCSDI